MGEVIKILGLDELKYIGLYDLTSDNQVLKEEHCHDG